MELGKKAAQHGEPIVRTMEYVYPHAGYENIKDQFFLGDEILVAPILHKNQHERTVILPDGQWTGHNGQLYQGNSTIKIKVDLQIIPYFQKT